MPDDVRLDCCPTCCSLDRVWCLPVTRKGHKIPLGVPETEKYVMPCPDPWHGEDA